MNKTSIKANLLALLASLIWGLAFVAQSAAMDYIEPLTFVALRSSFGFLPLLPFIFITDRRKGIKTVTAFLDKRLLLGGLFCGSALFAASILQQYGIKYTSVGKAGFITTLYVIIVPIFGLFLKKKAGLNIWLGVVIAVAGMYLLSVTDGLGSIGSGDIMLLLCAMAYSVQILVIDRFAGAVDSFKLAALQFFVMGVYSSVCALIFESPDITSMLAAWLPVLYTGVLSSCVAYTLQIVTQKKMHPFVASLIYSLEGVFALVGGAVILGQKPTGRELAGCVLIFSAVILAQLPLGKRKKAVSELDKVEMR